MNIGQYIDKYDMHIATIQGIDLTISLIIAVVFAIVAIVLFIGALGSLSKHSKTKKFSGKADATFISAEAYDEKAKKQLKNALVRYVINERPYVIRIFVPKEQRTKEKLVVNYNTLNFSEAVLTGDNSRLKKATTQFILTAVFLGLAILMYVI